MAESPVRRIWTLSGSNLGTTLTANGNSGGFRAPGSNPPENVINTETPIDLRYVDDVMLSVNAPNAPGGTTPSLKVQLNFFDNAGNLLTGGATPFLVTVALTAAGQSVVFGGRHGSSGGAYFVLPEWGQIAWTVTGTTPSFSGVEIALFGRG